MKTAIPPGPPYAAIWAVLMGLLGLTWALAQLPLGRWAAFTALGIASAKTLLVALYFMHVRRSPRLTRVFVAAGLIWLGILFDLTLSDYLTRSRVPSALQDSWRHPTGNPRLGDPEQPAPLTP